MKVVDSGTVYDGRTGPPHGRACRRTTLALASDGTLFVSFRRGTAQRSNDGHPVVYASADGGRSWELRYDGYGHGALDGTPGEAMAFAIFEITPGTLLATCLWMDHSDPQLPLQNPVTLGFLPMRIFHTFSFDGGWTWSVPQVMGTRPHLAATPATNSVIRLATGQLAQPYETWKEYGDPAPARSGAYLRFSDDGGHNWEGWTTVAIHPENALYYWDQRHALHPDTGRIACLFWTHDPVHGVDADIHISWGSPDARTWSVPTPTGLHGQYCQPLALGGDRLVSIRSDRALPGIVASRSDDFGRTWDRDRDLVVFRSRTAGDTGIAGASNLSELWQQIPHFNFGHPRGVLLPSGEIFALWHGSDEQASGVQWARIQP